MRIGIFRPGMSKPGGTETFLREVMRRLQDRHEICLVTDDNPLSGELEETDIEIYQLPMLNRFHFLVKEWFEIESVTLYASSRFRNIFEKIDADVWSTHYWLENLLLSRYLDEPNFFRFPGIKSPHIEWKIMAKLSEPDFYVGNSQDTVRRAKEWLGLECEDVVYAGVDLEQFNPNVDPAFENDDLNLMFVGRLDSGKGLPDLLRAFRELRKERNNLRLWLIGEGSLEEDLRREAREYDIADSVEFPGKINHSEIQRWYVAADVFCLPSYHEGFPVVNVEAMACGLPVVATNLESVQEQIDNGVEGFLFEKGNRQKLKENIEYLLEDPEDREKMSENAREKSQKFSWTEQAGKMEGLYERCCQL